MAQYTEDDNFCTWICPKCRLGIPVYHADYEELKILWEDKNA